MKRQQRMLVELQQAWLVISLASRMEGPRRPTSCLGEKRGLKIDADTLEEKYIHASLLAHLVHQIVRAEERRAVGLAMIFENGEPKHDLSSLAAVMRTSERSASRWLNDGLRKIEEELPRASRERFTPSIMPVFTISPEGLICGANNGVT